MDKHCHHLRFCTRLPSVEDLNQISPKAYGLAVTEEDDDDDDDVIDLQAF